MTHWVEKRRVGLIGLKKDEACKEEKVRMEYT